MLTTATAEPGGSAPTSAPPPPRLGTAPSMVVRGELVPAVGSALPARFPTAVPSLSWSCPPGPPPWPSRPCSKRRPPRAPASSPTTARRRSAVPVACILPGHPVAGAAVPGSSRTCLGRKKLTDRFIDRLRTAKSVLLFFSQVTFPCRESGFRKVRHQPSPARNQSVPFFFL